MNDETALVLRTLKDSAGNYLWKDINETIFSKPVQIVDSMPSIGKGQKVILYRLLTPCRPLERDRR